MNCTDCLYYKTKCEYGAEHIICSKTIKQEKTLKRRGENIINCQECPYHKQECEYGTSYIICSKKLKEVKQDKKEVKIDLQKKYINSRS